MPFDIYSAEHLAARRAALLRQGGYEGVDADLPKTAAGHVLGIAISTRITSDFRRTYRKQSMDITPQQVMDVLREAGINEWVLMGLHGYVGYLPEPRATQDVDILVPYSRKRRVVKALTECWPALEVRELPQVVRFIDPGEQNPAGVPQAVIDVMLPFSPFQKSILKHHVMIDPDTGDHRPTLEAAIASKYAALVLPHRDTSKKEYDAGDLRRIIRANYDNIDRDSLRELASQIWEQGGEELLAFLDIAREDKPFPI